MTFRFADRLVPLGLEIGSILFAHSIIFDAVLPTIAGRLCANKQEPGKLMQ